MSVGALALAAGRGERLGATTPKAFTLLAGRSLLDRSLAALCEVDAIDCVVPVVPSDWLESDSVRRIVSHPKLRKPVAGGAQRQDSVAAGMAGFPPSVTWVAVHDVARCLLDPRDAARAISSAMKCGAAILAKPVRDTVKRVRAGFIVETPPRAECWAAETPQVFRRDWLEAALYAAREQAFIGTDDAQLVERLGHSVAVVASEHPNPKITFPEDLVAAEAWLAARARRAAEVGA